MGPTPQEKQAYNTMVRQALSALYTPEMAQKVEEMAQQGNPAEAVASVTAIILKKIKEAAAGSGHELDMRYIEDGGNEVMGHVLEMLVAFKDIEQSQVASLYAEAKKIFMQIVGGEQPQQAQQGGLLAQGA